jgi:uncharacterized protein
MKKILITGGSGIIGKELAKILSNKAYDINILGRKKNKPDNLPYSFFEWKIDEGYLDINSLYNVDYIVHLAGENISEKRWTQEQRLLIESSRIKSAELIYKTCWENNIWPKAFISSSAIGYYGTFNSEKILSEDSPPGKDFLAQVCVKWEKTADLFLSKGIRTVKIRTGIVLCKNGGAYEKIANMANKGLAAALGSGKQYIPWIHIDDIVGIFIKAIEDENMQGVFNGVSPQQITNKELTQAIAKSMKRIIHLPNIPAFVLKASLGEMSDILLKGSRISSDKIQKMNYEFKFPEIVTALANLAI